MYKTIVSIFIVNLLQVGCEDGRVRLFEITADGLLYSKSLDQQEGINLAWDTHCMLFVNRFHWAYLLSRSAG